MQSHSVELSSKFRVVAIAQTEAKRESGDNSHTEAKADSGLNHPQDIVNEFINMDISSTDLRLIRDRTLEPVNLFFQEDARTIQQMFLQDNQELSESFYQGADNKREAENTKTSSAFIFDKGVGDVKHEPSYLSRIRSVIIAPDLFGGDGLSNMSVSKMSSTETEEIYFLASKAIEEGNLPLLELCLGAPVLYRESEYHQSYRDHRLSWLSSVMEYILVKQMKDIVDENYNLHYMLQYQADALFKVLETMTQGSTKIPGLWEKETPSELKEMKVFHNSIIARGASVPENELKNYLSKMQKFMSDKLRGRDLASSKKTQPLLINQAHMINLVKLLEDQLVIEEQNIKRCLENALKEEINVLFKERSQRLDESSVFERYHEPMMKLYNDALKKIVKNLNQETTKLGLKTSNNLSVLKTHIDKNYKKTKKSMEQVEANQKYVRVVCSNKLADILKYSSERTFEWIKPISDGGSNGIIHIPNSFHQVSPEAKGKDADEQRKNHHAYLADLKWFVKMGINRGRNIKNFLNLRDKEGNTLLHKALRKYAIARYHKKKKDMAEGIVNNTLQAFSQIVCLLYQHRFSPYIANAIYKESHAVCVTNVNLDNDNLESKKDTSNRRGQTAFEYANDQLLIYINERALMKVDKLEQNYHLPDYFLLKIGLQAIPTYSEFGTSLKLALIKSCDKARDELTSLLNRWFFPEVIKKIERTFYLAELAYHNNISSRELSDMFLVECINLLVKENTSSDKSTARLFHKLIFSELQNILNTKTLILSAPTKDINKHKEERRKKYERDKKAYEERMLNEKREKEAAEKNLQNAIARATAETERANNAIRVITRITEAVRIDSEAIIQNEQKLNIETNRAAMATERANIQAADRLRLEAERIAQDKRIRELEARLAECTNQEEAEEGDRKTEPVPDRTLSASHATMFSPSPQPTINSEASVSVAASVTNDIDLKVSNLSALSAGLDTGSSEQRNDVLQANASTQNQRIGH